MLPNKLYVIKPAQREKFEHKTFFYKFIFSVVYFNNKGYMNIKNKKTASINFKLKITLKQKLEVQT